MGILGTISVIFHRQEINGISSIFALLSIASLLFALFENNKSNKHPEERKILLNACLKIIDTRTMLTVKNIGEFRSVFKQYRYALTEEQKLFIKPLLSAVGDARINNEELTGLGEYKERSELISSNRSLLSKIEKSRLIIEQFLSETT